MPKGHGTESGVTADDLVKKDDIGKTQPATQPGKTNLVQSAETGDSWIDRGAKCEGQGGKAVGCFFADKQRDRLISDFQRDTDRAATNFKLAIVELKVAELMTKEDDLHWVLSLALDLAGMFVVSQAIKALTKIHAGQVQSIQDLIFATGEAPPKTIANQIRGLVASVSSDTIKAKVKAAGGFVTKGAKAIAKDATADSQKSVVISFLDQLQNGCDLGFTEFADNASANANDGELLVLWEGMHPSNHTVGAYKAALGEKLDRFKKSGVTKLGRKAHGADDTIIDRRVVWVQRHDGSRTLWYQQHTSTDNPGTLRPGEPGTADVYPDHKDSFGELGDAKAGLDHQVPAEFWNEALALSEAKWGATTTIADPFSKHMGVANDYKARMDAAKIKQAGVDGGNQDKGSSTRVKTDVPNYTPDQLAKDLGDQLSHKSGSKP